MSIIWFTAVAAILYLVSDRLLNWLEIRAGKRFEHRSLVFFAILLTLALATFSAIQAYTGNS
ncbi:MAG: hypothetical protein OEV41_04800 [Gammaproteobacteria bacterium]|nr:hypothetical protein [Gammaproteobacteria bacterium]